ncbi:MAG: hypothetical protein ABIT07_00300 [Ferruginibacter sp.]
MLTEKQLKQLKSENELLLLQLEDVNEVIKQREEELEELRIIARHATQLQSRLDLNLLEFEQMQNNIGEKQQEAEGTNLRLEELEKDLYNSIKMENKYNNLLDGHLSLQANLLDTNNELEEAAGLYKKLKDVKNSLTQTQSSLEMATIEIRSLKQELADLKKLNIIFRGNNE